MPDVTNDTEAAIAEIASDNTSGAAEILRRSAAVFRLLRPREQALCAVEHALNTIIGTCVALVSAQPDMSSLLRLASEAVSASRSQTTGPQAVRAARDAAHNFVVTAAASSRTAAAHAASLISDGSIILTHSRSSTVLAAFLEARRAGKFIEVIATESRPMFEGRKLACELAANEIKITIIADAAASLFTGGADMVLVGADRITPESLVNKIGTEMIALAARERGVPIFAVCDTSKFIAADYLAGMIGDQRNADELWPDPPNGIAIANNYFEPTPLSYFSGVITERGVMSNDEASAHAAGAYIDPLLSQALQGLRRGIR